ANSGIGLSRPLGLKHNMTTNSKRKWEKAWQTVGRFLSGFAALEGLINDVFVELYNLEQSSAFMTLETWPCLKDSPDRSRCDGTSYRARNYDKLSVKHTRGTRLQPSSILRPDWQPELIRGLRERRA